MDTHSVAEEKILELYKGKVVRISQEGWMYKLVRMETMASIIISPVNPAEKTNLLSQVQTCGYCTMTQAEILIEHICNYESY